MPEFVTTCPYCKAEQTAFFFGGEVRTEQFVWVTLWVCRRCSEGIVVRLEQPHEFAGRTVEHPPSTIDREICSCGYRVLSSHPRPARVQAPDHVPQGVAQSYVEALDSLDRRNFNAAGAMCRATLDKATKLLLPDGEDSSKMSLYRRIERLAELRILTSALQEWAHIVRDEGNEALHALHETDEITARDLCHFTEMFLYYAYTMPGYVSAYRGE